jgi:hypothetical protein
MQDQLAVIPSLYRPINVIVLIALGIVLAACGETGAEQQTLIAHEATTEARFNELYITATVEAEIMLLTLEHAGTQAARAISQRNAMISTLQARGVDTSVLPGVTPESPPTPAPSTGNNNEPPPVEVTPGVQVTPFTVTPVVEVEDDQPYLTDFVMAEGVGADDCPVGATSQFSPAAERIYIVATAHQIEPGTALSSTWFRDETELVAFTFTPDFAIDGNCIWFYADQSNFDFAPGSYRIRLEINGAPAAEPVPFTIVAPADDET